MDAHDQREGLHRFSQHSIHSIQSINSPCFGCFFCLDFAVGTGPRGEDGGCSHARGQLQVARDARCWARSGRDALAGPEATELLQEVSVVTSLKTSLGGYRSAPVYFCIVLSVSSALCLLAALVQTSSLLLTSRAACCVLYVLDRQVPTKTCVSSDCCVLLHQWHVFRSAICFSYLQPAAAAAVPWFTVTQLQQPCLGSLASFVERHPSIFAFSWLAPTST